MRDVFKAAGLAAGTVLLCWLLAVGLPYSAEKFGDFGPLGIVFIILFAFFMWTFRSKV